MNHLPQKIGANAKQPKQNNSGKMTAGTKEYKQSCLLQVV